METWAADNGAVSLQEVIDNLDMLLDEVAVDEADARRLKQLKQLS